MDIFRVFMDIDKMAHEIDYPVNKVNNTKEYNYLITAMDSSKTGKSKNDRVNSRLALIGDKILDIVVEDYCYRELDMTTPQIDEVRRSKLSDDYQYKVFRGLGLEKYAYNDSGFYGDEGVDVAMNDDDFPYLEAIVGAAYYDAGRDQAFRWAEEKILPLLDIKK